MGCCSPGGYVHPDKQEMFRRMAAAGVPMSDGAMIWGADDRFKWRVVNRDGSWTGIESLATLREIIDAGPGIEVQRTHVETYLIEPEGSKAKREAQR